MNHADLIGEQFLMGAQSLQIANNAERFTPILKHGVRMTEDSMTRRLAISFLVLTAMLGAGTQLVAHEGHEHKVMGTVTMAMADHVMLKATDGKDLVIQVTKDTKVFRGKEAMKAQDIKVGTRVVITAIEEKTQMRAVAIQVGPDARPAAQARPPLPSS